MDTIFKKWGYVEEVRNAARILKDSVKRCKNAADPVILESYKDCIDDMLTSLMVNDRIERSQRNVEFCKKVQKAQDRYHRRNKKI
ncbi:MAG: hypothetical protein K6B70_04890 [Clostridia bacterium]|nr:hypothetical protein [Clostridia bacterium]